MNLMFNLMLNEFYVKYNVKWILQQLKFLSKEFYVKFNVKCILFAIDIYVKWISNFMLNEIYVKSFSVK